MHADNLTERLPTLRCTPEMKTALVNIAQRSVARNIADHMRYAIELYIKENAGKAEGSVKAEEKEEKVAA